MVCLSPVVRRWRLLDPRIRQYICPPGKAPCTCTGQATLTDAKQDKLDDVHAGIRSTALLFGINTRPILTGLSLSSLTLISYAGYLNSQGLPFYFGVGLAALQLAHVLHRTDFDNRQSCWKGFVGCGWAGFWIWMGSLSEYIVLMSSQQVA